MPAKFDVILTAKNETKAAFDAMAAEANRASSQLRRAASAAETAFGKVPRTLGTSTDALAKAEMTAAGAHTHLSTQSMAASHALRGMTEQIAMGVSPTQALTMQMSHLSFAASGEGGLVGALKGAGAAFEPLLTLPNIAAIGVIGLALAIPSIWDAISGGSQQQAANALKYQKKLVDDLTAAYPKLGKAAKDALSQSPSATENQILVTSQKAIEAAQKQAASLASGLSQQISSAYAMNLGVGSILTYVPEVRDQVKALNDQFNAGTITATTFSDKLAGLELNPDLPQMAKALLDNFIGITNQIAAAEVQASAFASTMDALKNNGGVIIGGDFGQLKSSVDLVDKLRSMTPDLRSASQKAIDYYNSNSGLDADGSGKKQLDYTLSQIKLQDAQKTSRKTTKKIPESDYAKELKSIRDKTAALTVQDKAIGLSTYASARLTEQTTLENAARKDSIGLTPERIKQIGKEAEAYAQLSAQVEQDQAIYNTAHDAFMGFFDSQRQYLAQGEGFWQSWADAGKKAISDLLAKASDALLNNAFQELWSGGSKDGKGGIGGWVTNAVDSLISTFHFAGGTAFAPGGPSIVGESGPEIVNLPRGSQVIPASRSSGMMNGGQNITFAPQTTITAGQGGMTAAQLKAALDTRDREIYRRLPAILADKRHRGALA